MLFSLTEGDLIIGADQASAIGTLVERPTRTIRLLHMPARDGQSLHAAIVARMGDLPAIRSADLSHPVHTPGWLLAAASALPILTRDSRRTAVILRNC